MAKKNQKNAVPVPPDGGYGWVVLIACFLISFVIDGVMYSFGIVLSDIKDYYGVSQEKANLLASLNTGFLFCSGPIVSGLSNQFGIRPVVMVGAIVTSLMYVLSAYLPSIYYTMITYGVIGGISTGCTYIASLIIVAQYFDKLQGIATGVTMAGSGVGAFAFAPIAQLLISNFDWKYTMVILGGIILECCLMGALLRPVPTRVLKPKEKVEHDASKNVQAFTGSIVSISNLSEVGKSDSCLTISLNILKEMTNLSLLTKNVGFLFITLSNFFIFTGYFIPFIYIPLRAKELHIENYSFILGLIGIINIPARLTFGFLADRRFLSPLNLNTLCVSLATLSLWSYPLLTTFYTQCIFSVTFAIGIAGMNCLTTPYLKDIVGMDKFSNAMGILNLFRGFGCFLGPFVGGFISESLSSILAAFFFSSVLFSIGLAFTIIDSFGIKCKWFKIAANYEAANQSAPEA